MSDQEHQFEGAHGHVPIGKQSVNPTVAERNKAIDEGFKILSHERAQQMADYHKSMGSFWQSEAETLKKGEG